MSDATVHTVSTEEAELAARILAAWALQEGRAFRMPLRTEAGNIRGALVVAITPEDGDTIMAMRLDGSPS